MNDIDKATVLLCDMYNAIYTTAQKVCLLHTRIDVPINTLKQIIDKTKLKPMDTPTPAGYDTLVIAHNNSLEILYKHCNDMCTHTHHNGVTLQALKIFIDTLIEQTHKQTNSTKG